MGLKWGESFLRALLIRTTAYHSIIDSLNNSTTDYLIIMAVLDYYFWVMSVRLIWKDLYKELGKKGGNVAIKLKKVKWQENP